LRGMTLEILSTVQPSAIVPFLLAFAQTHLKVARLAKQVAKAT